MSVFSWHLGSRVVAKEMEVLSGKKTSTVSGAFLLLCGKCI